MTESIVSGEIENICRGPTFGDFVTIFTGRGGGRCRGGTTWTGDFKCREVKTGFCRNRSMQTGSSGTLIGWKSGQTTFVPLWDRMEGEWLWTQDNMVARLQSTRVQTPLSIKCNVLRKSLSEDSQNIPCATLKRRGSWVISIYLWLSPIF